MFLIVIYSLLLTFGFLSSQSTLMDHVISEESIHIIASACLAYIMLAVGLEFYMPKKKNLEDQAAAFLGAVVPWILTSIYIIFVLSSSPMASISSGLLLGCFAAPTSAGILFSMLEAAGLEKSWVFQKAKMLAVLDDIYTLILIIPLRALNFGMSMGLLYNMFIVLGLFYIGYKFPHSIKAKTSEKSKIFISIFLTLITVLLTKIGIEIDVVTPAFVLGWMIKPDHEEKENILIKNLVSGCFMFMVGASMPNIKDFLTNQEGEFFMIGIHVLAVTQLSNIGKFCSALFYRKEASIKERIALSVSMLPRGEVGAGILMIAATAGIKGIAGAVAILSLALNLTSTGFLIKIVKTLLSS